MLLKWNYYNIGSIYVPMVPFSSPSTSQQAHRSKVFFRFTHWVVHQLTCIRAKKKTKSPVKRPPAKHSNWTVVTWFYRRHLLTRRVAVLREKWAWLDVTKKLFISGLRSHDDVTSEEKYSKQSHRLKLTVPERGGDKKRRLRHRTGSASPTPHSSDVIALTRARYGRDRDLP